MTLKVNPENTLVISQFGHRILFDGYLIDETSLSITTLNINHLLFDGYLIKTKKQQLAKNRTLSGTYSISG